MYLNRLFCFSLTFFNSLSWWLVGILQKYNYCFASLPHTLPFLQQKSHPLYASPHCLISPANSSARCYLSTCFSCPTGSVCHLQLLADINASTQKGAAVTASLSPRCTPQVLQHSLPRSLKSYYKTEWTARVGQRLTWRQTLPELWILLFPFLLLLIVSWHWFSLPLSVHKAEGLVQYPWILKTMKWIDGS